MVDTVSLRIQRLGQGDQVLALARVASARTDSAGFSGRDMLDVYTDLALPPPGNVHAVFRSLRDSGLLTQPGRGQYRLTPRGRQRSHELLDRLDEVVLGAEAAAEGGAEFGHASSVVLPSYLAPPELIHPLRDFLSRHPFETNVFGMTRFPDEADPEEDPDPVAGALDVAASVCADHGLDFHLASHRAIHRDLWTNVAGHMWASRYGISFFEDRRQRGVNYNLTIECGAMLMAGRRLALLKDESVGALPTDFVGHIYKPVDLGDLGGVSDTLHRWMRDDLALGVCDSCPDG